LNSIVKFSFFYKNFYFLIKSLKIASDFLSFAQSATSLGEAHIIAALPHIICAKRNIVGHLFI